MNPTGIEIKPSLLGQSKYGTLEMNRSFSCYHNSIEAYTTHIVGDIWKCLDGVMTYYVTIQIKW